MNKTYLLLGSNIGDTKEKISKAKSLIEKYIGNVICQSGLYQTAAWGDTDQPDFVNQAIITENKMSAYQTMKIILDIEKEMGRIRTKKNAPRIIDIDIIFYNDEIINSKDLIIPHPLMQERRFVLIPLNEISPDFIHPVFNKKICELLAECSDKLPVKKI